MVGDPFTLPGRKRLKPLPTVERLRELLTYDPATGELRNRVDRFARARAGALAGTFRKDGYLTLVIDGSRVLGHRVIWAMMTGAWPEKLIDHEDTNPSNNRWRNLREASSLQNTGNMSLPKHNTNGLKCVRERKGRFQAHITINRKQVWLGSFATEAEAVAAYEAAAAAHFGAEFARAA